MSIIVCYKMVVGDSARNLVLRMAKLPDSEFLFFGTTAEAIFAIPSGRDPVAKIKSGILRIINKLTLAEFDVAALAVTGVETHPELDLSMFDYRVGKYRILLEPGGIRHTAPEHVIELIK
ncbi:MAG: hypothetical protein HPZ91_15385 [Lentisphaeria bacterium]|nr:hypothetical protein [Lentisphaeria bacterium]MBS1371329.1 hypothetical protein [Lentisphaeria bacterium]